MIEDFLIGWVIGLLTIPLGHFILPAFFGWIEKKVKERREGTYP